MKLLRKIFPLMLLLSAGLFFSCAGFGTDVPANLSATQGTSDAVALTWDAVDSALSYNVYRSSSASGTYSLIGVAYAATYNDTSVSSTASYYYEVASVMSSGESDKSDNAMGYPIRPDSYEPDNTSGTANVLTYNVQQTHSIRSGGDIDWVSFAATGSSVYNFKTLTAGAGKVNVDTVIYLYDTDQTTLLDSDDDGAGSYNFSWISGWTCPLTGTYYLKITGFSGSSKGDYKVYVY